MEFPAEISSILQSVKSIPYENLSKIVAWSRDSDWVKVLDTPEKLVAKAESLSAGGTCFSLTYYLYTQMKEAGFESVFLLADKYHFKNIHCGLLFIFEGTEYLLDPGYMIYSPMEIPLGGLMMYYPFVPNEICLENRQFEDVLRLHTGKRGDLKFRFDFRKVPVSLETFFEHWKNSYHFDMMKYPVLNRVLGGAQHYIQKLNYLKRSSTGSEFVKLNRESFEVKVKEVFGLSEELIEESIQVLLQKHSNLF